MPAVPPMSTMHEEMHQRTGEEQQIGQEGPRVLPVLGRDIVDPGDPENGNDAHHDERQSERWWQSSCVVIMEVVSELPSSMHQHVHTGVQVWWVGGAPRRSSDV